MFLKHLAYALYAPLYIARPIFTVNNFMLQVRPALSALWLYYSHYVPSV